MGTIHIHAVRDLALARVGRSIAAWDRGEVLLRVAFTAPDGNRSAVVDAAFANRTLEAGTAIGPGALRFDARGDLEALEVRARAAPDPVVAQLHITDVIARMVDLGATDVALGAPEWFVEIALSDPDGREPELVDPERADDAITVDCHLGTVTVVYTPAGGLRTLDIS